MQIYSIKLTSYLIKQFFYLTLNLINKIKNQSNYYLNFISSSDFQVEIADYPFILLDFSFSLTVYYFFFAIFFDYSKSSYLLICFANLDNSKYYLKLFKCYLVSFISFALSSLTFYSFWITGFTFINFSDYY